MIVDAGKVAMAAHLTETFDRARIGVGGNSTSPLATTLDVPIYSLITISPSSSNSNVVDFKFTVLGATIAGYVIREIAIFNTAGTTMLTRINFDGVGPFASGEDVDFYVTLEVE